jgi:hypothetical protein
MSAEAAWILRAESRLVVHARPVSIIAAQVAPRAIELVAGDKAQVVRPVVTVPRAAIVLCLVIVPRVRISLDVPKPRVRPGLLGRAGIAVLHAMGIVVLLGRAPRLAAAVVGTSPWW